MKASAGMAMARITDAMTEAMTKILTGDDARSASTWLVADREPVAESSPPRVGDLTATISPFAPVDDVTQS